MKNFSIIMNVVLAVAVVVLYVLHFSGNKSDQAKSSSGSFDMSDVSIAYINSDSLKNYDYFKDIAKQMEEKQAKAQQEYQRRAEGLQREIAEFQQTAGTMTINQAKAVEENLMQRRQNLALYEQNLSRSLMEEEQKMFDELYNRVSDYLKDYGTNNNLKLVLTYQKGSGVLFANDSMNITSNVIEGLNAAYKTEKESPKKADPVADKADSVK